MLAGADPVRAGLIASLARPGANITGVVTLVPELIGKRLELLFELVITPKTARSPIEKSPPCLDQSSPKNPAAFVAEASPAASPVVDNTFLKEPGPSYS